MDCDDGLSPGSQKKNTIASHGDDTDRDRAAYWDGRNTVGDPVASGIYFYQFETDDLSSLRKRVILK